LITRARLVRETGNFDNHVMLRFNSAAPPPGSSATPTYGEPYVIQKMDEWLMNLRGDTRTYATTAQKVTANKPVDLVDACYSASGEKINETQNAANTGRCGEIMPFYANPRIAAGALWVQDILKCQLTPLKQSDYPNMSASQFARLSALFSSGVCDFSRPGVGVKPLKGTWLSYTNPGVVPTQLQLP
jgi:hypothetical protein